MKGNFGLSIFFFLNNYVICIVFVLDGIIIFEVFLFVLCEIVEFL